MAHEDGRRQRRARNRDAVVDALLAIVADGDLAPNAEAVAARAGLSSRSLFRYFDDVDDLCRAAIARQHERVATLLERPVDVDGGVASRARDAVTHRVDLFDAMGDVGRLARLRAPFQPLIADQLAAIRRLLRERMRRRWRSSSTLPARRRRLSTRPTCSARSRPTTCCVTTSGAHATTPSR